MSATVKTAELRAEFPPSQVGKLPRITCPDCSQSRGRVCSEHRKGRCQECGNFITERHIHLDYVGHGAVTHRLLEVDPAWSWEPLAFDDRGLPFMERDRNGSPVSLWIRLTVCGVTRLGVGTCPAGQFDAEKVLIGDALRNAAMRFGVALDLWVKGHGEDDEVASATDDRSAPDRTPEPCPPGLRTSIEGAISRLTDDQKGALKAWFRDEGLPPVRQLDAEQADRVIAHLMDLPAETASESGPSPSPDSGAPTEGDANE